MGVGTTLKMPVRPAVQAVFAVDVGARCRGGWTASAVSILLLASVGGCGADAPDGANTQGSQDNAAAAAAPGAAGPAKVEEGVYTGACDGSAAAILQDRLIVVGNDEDNSLRVYRSTPAGGDPVGDPFDLGPALGITDRSEADIEGAARDGDRIYWITSHGRDGDALEAPARQRLFATTWNGSVLAMSGAVRKDLLSALLAFGDANGLDLRGAEPKAPKEGGINIEGLATANGGALLLGFRSPLVPMPEKRQRDPNAKAIVIPLLNPAELLANAGAQPRFGPPIRLKLGGQGIRSLEREAAGKYLIVAGDMEEGGTFALFRWSGRSGDDPLPLKTSPAPLSAEALLVQADGSVLLLSDDGSKVCKKADEDAKRFRARSVGLDD